MPASPRGDSDSRMPSGPPAIWSAKVGLVCSSAKSGSPFGPFPSGGPVPRRDPFAGPFPDRAPFAGPDPLAGRGPPELRLIPSATPFGPVCARGWFPPPGVPTAFAPHGRRERHRRRRPATRHDQREVAMNDQPLRGKKVAILATDGVEISEYVQPRAAVENAGAQVELISIKNGEIQGFHHLDKADRFPVDKLARDADPNEYDALLLPGGVANPDQL